MYCSVCGNSNQDGAADCATCGRPLTAREEGPVPEEPKPASVSSRQSSQPAWTAYQPTAPPTSPVMARPPYPCLVCGATLGYNDFTCKRCSAPRGRIVDPYSDAPGVFLPGTALWDPPDPAERSRPSNDSGQGRPVSPEISRGWNWGAFWLPVFWGISHRTHQTLIVFVLAAITLCADGLMFLGNKNMLVEMGLVTVILWMAGIPLSVWYGRMGNAWAWQ